LKNRTIIGIICMVLAIAITFLVAPLVTQLGTDTVTVYCVAQDLKQGVQITQEYITTVEAKAESIPAGAVAEKAEILGKYAKSNLYAGDFYTTAKLTADANTAADVFATLDGKQIAVSFTINSFAAGLSGKLENGDIISIFVTDPDTGVTTIPAALKYVRVVTTTTAGGIDQEGVVENEDGSFELPSTVTVLVTPEQARLLVSYEENAALQAGLVYRGDKETAQKFLDKQTEYLLKGAAEENE